MPTIISEGFQTATVGTTHTLWSDSTNKIYVGLADLANMQSGDVVELSLLTKLSSASTLRLAYGGTYAHVQSDPNKFSVPIPADVYIEYRLLQSAGTSRVFPWKLLSA